ISQGFDGVIVEPTQSAMSNPNINYYLNLESLHIPYVMIHAYYDELNPVSITMEEEKGGFIQTEHLINLGHQQIMGFFKIDDNQGIKRMKGFLNANRKNGLSINPNYVITYNKEDKKGEFIQTENIINLSNQQIIGFFKIDNNQGIKRMKGFLNAHRKNGLSINPNYVITYNTEDKKEKPAQVLTSLLSDHKNNHP